MIYRYFQRTVLWAYVALAGFYVSRRIYESWHDVPDYADFQVIQHMQNRAVGLTLFLLMAFLVGLIIVAYLLLIPEERRQEREREAWRNNHVHDWNGCICTDPKCWTNQHVLDDDCKCVNCGNVLHNTETHEWDFGSTRVTDETCKRCTQIVASSSYYAG